MNKQEVPLNKLISIFGEEIPLVRLVSILGLIGVGLFFVGWIYRWAYFSFFQVQITALNFSPQSFLFVPLQVFFGDPLRIALILLNLIISITCIYVITWLFHLFTTQTAKISKQWEQRLPYTANKKTLKSYAQKIILSFLRFNKTKADSLKLLRGLIEELIIVLLVSFVLYWFARTQGINDARRDASPKSTLPAISFITKEAQLPIGIKLDNPLAVPPVKGFSIIGDREMFKSLRDKEETDITDPKNPRVWRLLFQQDGWFYLFYNLPTNAPPDQRPLVLALKESQMLILSPEPTKP